MEKEQALQALLDQVVRQGDFIGVSALYLRVANSWFMTGGHGGPGTGHPLCCLDTICRVFSMSKPSRPLR